VLPTDWRFDDVARDASDPKVWPAIKDWVRLLGAQGGGFAGAAAGPGLPGLGSR
jgi:hypothetical protein